VKDEAEEMLFARRRHLFTGLDLVFMDTTSIYFEGAGGETLGRYGHSKDHRPDLRQMVVAVVLDGEGNPVCSELWPGNTADVTTLVPVAKRLRERFAISDVCIVADRGMISDKTMGKLEEMGWRYILGVRMRLCREVRLDVLGRGGRYHEVVPERTRSHDPSPLKVKEVEVAGRRYIVCLNEEQARKDAHDREAIVASLKEALARGDKSLVGNRGYRKYLAASPGRFEIDEAKVAEDARYDGKWVLTTNTDLSARDAALKYKQLWMVEDIFRSMKTLLETRPVFHKCDETIRGHVWCSFLALVLRKELERRLDALPREPDEPPLEWADIRRDLEALTETEIAVGPKRYIIRAEARRAAAMVFRACGTALPPTLRQVRPATGTQAGTA
jgi:transposase